LEDVVLRFLTLAEDRVEKARNESNILAEEIDKIDDLEQAESPETCVVLFVVALLFYNYNCSLMLSAVSGAHIQDRADRLLLSPWLRFLWDSYRNCLELLRNSEQVTLFCCIIILIMNCVGRSTLSQDRQACV
jgi:translation initiation factor 3 subunit A